MAPNAEVSSVERNAGESYANEKGDVPDDDFEDAPVTLVVGKAGWSVPPIPATISVFWPRVQARMSIA